MKKNNKSKDNKNSVETRLSRLESRLSTKHMDFKFTDQSAALTPATAGTVYYMSAIAEDDTRSGRTGEKITLEYIDWSWNAIATTTSNWRMVLLRDLFNQGAAPAVGDILQSASVASNYNYTWFVNNKRFSVMFDKTLSFSSAGSLSNASKVKLGLRGALNLFSGTGNTSSSAAAGSIWLLVISDTATPGTLNTYFRVVFTDV